MCSETNESSPSSVRQLVIIGESTLTRYCKNVQLRTIAPKTANHCAQFILHERTAVTVQTDKKYTVRVKGSRVPKGEPTSSDDERTTGGNKVVRDPEFAQ